MSAGEFGTKAWASFIQWRVAVWRIAVGAILVVYGVAIAALPAQDWIDPVTLKKVLFAVGLSQAVLKAVDMALDQTVSLIRARFSNGNGNGDTAFIPKPPTQ